jgi:hypothetical protein
MQVCKDRQNWAGKVPKRQLFHGPASPFDWEGEAKKIREAKETNLSRSASGVSDYSCTGTESDYAPPTPAPTPTPTVTVPPVKKENCKFDVAWIGTCYECRVAVWVGPPDAVVAGIGHAYPENTDWFGRTNLEPYCSCCWADEGNFLDGMAAGHKVTLTPTLTITPTHTPTLTLTPTQSTGQR